MSRHSAPTKKKRNSVTLKQKSYALELLEKENLSFTTVSLIMGISRGAIYLWKKTTTKN